MVILVNDVYTYNDSLPRLCSHGVKFAELFMVCLTCNGRKRCVGATLSGTLALVLASFS